MMAIAIAAAGLAACQSGVDAGEHAALQQELAALQAENARTEASRSVVMQMWETVFTNHDVAAGFDRYIHPDYIQHNPLAADGPEPARKFLTEWFAKNPGAFFDVKKVAAAGDLVFIHHHFGTSRDVRGNAAVDIFRVQDGKVIEHWDVVQPMPEQSLNPHPMF
jgi:predicted SnoaL-like aldol condensation-catalyzing enzyme